MSGEMGKVRPSFLKVLVMFEPSLRRRWYKLYFKGPIMHPFREPFFSRSGLPSGSFRRIDGVQKSRLWPRPVLSPVLTAYLINSLVYFLRNQTLLLEHPSFGGGHEHVFILRRQYNYPAGGVGTLGPLWHHQVPVWCVSKNTVWKVLIDDGAATGFFNSKRSQINHINSFNVVTLFKFPPKLHTMNKTLFVCLFVCFAPRNQFVFVAMFQLKDGGNPITPAWIMDVYYFTLQRGEESTLILICQVFLR